MTFTISVFSILCTAAVKLLICRVFHKLINHQDTFRTPLTQCIQIPYPMQRNINAQGSRRRLDTAQTEAKENDFLGELRNVINEQYSQVLTPRGIPSGSFYSFHDECTPLLRWPSAISLHAKGGKGGNCFLDQDDGKSHQCTALCFFTMGRLKID